MAGKDLLDQRGARTRQADDEDRVRSRAPALAHLRNEGAGECRRRRPRLGREQVCIIAHQRAAQAIALVIMPEGERRVAHILISLAE